ncbi:MAG: prepilin-type N-terminal cleavage/methylation domain-containing protein [Lachnospiraceae bacterium]|nr:prepilin-type N-terminal cleavage/methylation domain-containing protein [Lachnospiraceae bacterium]
MKNNRGLSYVELLVVIAIMAILVGVTTLSMGLVYRTNAAKTGEKLVTSLKTARTYTLAKGSEKGAFHIRKVGSQYQCAVGDLSDDLKFEIIGNEPVEICYYFDSAGDACIPIVATTGTVTVKFDQSNGAVTSCSVGTEVPNGFKIYKDDKLVADIVLYKLTGKCEMNLE